MEQLHAHEVLHMMEGNSYTELSLREAIIQKFGEQQRFFTCSANNMDVDTLIEFLKRKGKFIPANGCLLYTSPSPRDLCVSRMPSSA